MSTELLIPRSNTLVANAAVDDEMLRAGLGFAEMLNQTGMAVAETQDKLTDSAVKTTSALAKTLVDIIAVEEKEYDDQGQLTGSISHTRKLPLLSLIDPVFYQWSSVRVQGQFYAKEFASDYSSDSYSSQSKSGRVGIIFGLGINASSSSSTDTHVDSEYTDDVSFGRMRMSALLEPRDDVSIPKANHVLRGPRISVLLGQTEELIENEITYRTQHVMLQLNRRDGTAISGKQLSIDSDGLLWEFADENARTTDANGQVEIILKRSVLEGEEKPEESILVVRLGLVSERQAIKL